MRTRLPSLDRRSSLLPVWILFGFVLILSGCKTPDFIGNRYSNFTAYYNTFYNAERQFRSGYENLDRTDVAVDRERYLPLFVKTTGSSASREFEQTVLKSANLLREHPDSKWVDDALMLIGKSYFYQENYVGAIQKFNEVIEVESDLEDEAQFWLARSLTTSGAYAEAEETLSLAINEGDANARWMAQYSLLLGELSLQQELWEDAASYLASALPEIKDKQLAARTAFLLGQIEEQRGNWEASVTAYEAVRGYRPPYELDYAARYSAVRVKGMYVDGDRALADLRRMERDDKNFSKSGEMRFLRARIMQEIGRDDEAFDIYDGLLYDPLATPGTGGGTSIRGRVHYALGELYRDIDGNYVMAAAHFDTAAASLTTPGAGRSAGRVGASSTRELFAPEAITDAADLKTSYAAFSRIYRDVARFDSLLWLGSLPQEEYDAKILELRQKRAEELEEQRRIMEERQREQAFRNASNENDAFLNRGLPEGKVIPTLDDPTGQAGGFLFHEDPIRVQEGRVSFQQIWGNRPRVPNWRRQAAISATDVEMNEEQLAEQEAMLEQIGQNELPDIDDSAVPRDSTSQVEMKADRAISRYELGNILFLGMAMPDSAAVWYRQVIEEDGQEPVAQRALYAMAEVQGALGDSTSAMRLYRDILDRFPESDFIPNVRERLGLENDGIVATDSTQMAIVAFERAISWSEDDSVAVADSLLRVAIDWVEFPESNRALFALGERHLMLAAADSAAIFAPVAHSMPEHELSVLWPGKFEPLPEPVEADSLAMDSTSVDLTANDEAAEDSAGGDSLAVEELPVDTTAIDMTAIDVAVDDSTAADVAEADVSEADLTAEDVASADSSMAVDLGSMDESPSDSTAAGSVDPTLESDIDSATADSLGAVLSEDAALSDSSLVQPAMDDAPVEEEEEEEVLTVEDLFKRISSTDSRGPLGIRAKGWLDAIVERRTPPEPVDTMLVDSLATDSLALDSLNLEVLAADSVAVGQTPAAVDVAGDVSADSVSIDQAGAVVAEERGKVLETVEEEPEVRQSQTALPDSVVLAMVARAAAQTDSLAAARAAARAVPTPAAPVSGSEFDSGEGEDEVRASTLLRPILPTGRPDLDATGYTFTFGSHFDFASARDQLNDLRTSLDSTGVPLYIITESEGERSEYLVGWGLFETIAERNEALEMFAAFLPERRNLLHLLPTTERIP